MNTMLCSLPGLYIGTSLLIGISGCGKVPGVNFTKSHSTVKLTQAHFLGSKVLERRNVPIKSTSLTERMWNDGQFLSLEVTWDRKPDVRFTEVWIGYDSADTDQRELIGYSLYYFTGPYRLHDRFRVVYTNDNQAYLTINLQDIPSARRSQINHVTLINRIDDAPVAQDAYSLNARAWRLATFPIDAARNGTLAVKYAKDACEQTKWEDANNMDTLAAAYAEVGDFPGALAMQRKAITLLTTLDDSRQTEFSPRLKLYGERQKCRSWE